MKKTLTLLVMAGILALGPAWTAWAQQTAGQTEAADDEFSDDFGDDSLDFLEDEDEDLGPAATINDPIEGFNRAMFAVNDSLYFYCLKPVGQGYKAITPSCFRVGVKNFFQNLETPLRLVNCLLQGKLKKAGSETLRFMVNTTVGVGGLGDPAAKYNDLELADEDMGQTFAVWGAEPGPYIVLPILGPNSTRHMFGRIPDQFLKPSTHIIKQWETSLMVWAGENINDVTFRIGDYEALKEASIDPYEAVRNGYVQYREKKIAE